MVRLLAAADVVLDLLNSWQCSTLVIGMCFDTTAANTGKVNGACTLLENAIGRNLLWMACRHHIFEILLADTFGICLGPSTGPDVLMFKRFKEKWSNLNHTPQQRSTPIIAIDEDLKLFIMEYLSETHDRDDYKELLNWRCWWGLTQE